MTTFPPFTSASAASLQFLLFVDERPSTQDSIRDVRRSLTALLTGYEFDLQVLEISQQPHLVEHFRLVATPALVKVLPEPRQVLAGSNIISQLQKWWPRWEQSLQSQVPNLPPSCPRNISAVGYSSELMKMSDELFSLKKENEELTEKMRFKDQILAMLAHDLRSPLTAASLAVETLELIHKKPLDEQSAALKSQLMRQTRKQFKIMNRLIADILQASKNLSAQFDIQSAPLCLAMLFGDILDVYQDQLQEQSLSLVYDMPQDLPNVFADEELIRQVVANLLDNAIKYTPPQGKITVSALHRTTQKVQVSITDTGPGIPANQVETIFEGHFRLQRDQEKDGYGLGLSFCRKIIQAHYGQIWVDSRPHQGSSFHFTLPVYR